MYKDVHIHINAQTYMGTHIEHIRTLVHTRSCKKRALASITSTFNFLCITHADKMQLKGLANVSV